MSESKWEVVKLPNEERGCIASTVGELIKALQQVPENFLITPCGSSTWGILMDKEQEVVLMDEVPYLENLLIEQEEGKEEVS